MKRLGYLIAAVAGLTLGTGQTAINPALAQAPAPVVKPDWSKAGRGHVTPKNLAEIKAKAFQRNGHVKLPHVTAPDWDSRTLGIVGPIEDQSQCGSCWDFSGCEVVQSANIKAGKLKNDASGSISRQYILDCNRNGGCNGDDNTTVLDAAKTGGGIPLTSAYGAYTASSNKCKAGPFTMYGVDDWGFADGGQGNGVTPVQQIKDAVAQYGMVGCGVDASGFDNYNGGVLQGTGHNIDHDVAIVGWHDDPTIKSGGYWIVPNSWGTSFGENGYLRMAYGAYDVGTEAVWAIVKAPPAPPTPPGPIPPGPIPPAPNGAPVISSALTATASLGAVFTYTIVASNSPTDYGAANLPSGVRCDESTGVVSGMPKTSGAYNVTISAANGSGTTSATLVLTVTNPTPPPPTAITVTLTPEQVAKVLSDAGAIVITDKTTLEEINAARRKEPAKRCCGQPSEAAKDDIGEIKAQLIDQGKKIEVLLRGYAETMRALLPKDGQSR